MTHPIVHVEISSRDRAESAKFYESVFGWNTQDMPEMNYTMFDSSEFNLSGGGFNPVSDENPAGTVTIYIQTDDIEASLVKIIAGGGTAVTPKTEIPQMGWFALFKDPSDNLVGLYTPMAQP